MLLSTAQLRTYIRATAADDPVITELRDEALGLIQATLGRAIEVSGSFGGARRYAVLKSTRYGDASSTVCSVGSTLGPLALHPGYSTWIEPLLNGALRACVAHWAQNRNPGASSESETGSSASYFPDGLPPRAKSFLGKLQGLTS